MHSYNSSWLIRYNISKEAEEVATLADGVIVGSAIVKRAQEPDLDKFIRSLKRGIDKARNKRRQKA